MRNALWVGGPPGKTLDNIKAKLEQDGINVSVVQTNGYRSIPQNVDVVLVNIDMLDHGSFDEARADGRKVNIPVVSVRTDYSRTRIALASAGLVDPAAPLPKEEEAVVTTNSNAPSNPKDAAEQWGKNPAALAQFLAALSKESRQTILEEAQRLARSENVESALLAFAELDDAGIADFAAAIAGTPAGKTLSRKLG